MSREDVSPRSLRTASRRFEMVMDALPKPMFRGEDDGEAATVFVLKDDPLKGATVVARRVSRAKDAQ